MLLMEIGLTLGGLGGGLVGGWFLGRQSEQRLAARVDRVPEATRTAVSADLSVLVPALAQLPELGERASPPTDFPAFVGYANALNEAGRELLIMHPTGAHATALMIWGRSPGNSELEMRARLTSPPGATFQLDDFDDDAEIEIATLDYDYSVDPQRALASMPLQPVIYRWNETELVEVARGESFDSRAGQRPSAEVSRFLTAPEWAMATPSRARHNTPRTMFPSRQV